MSKLDFCLLGEKTQFDLMEGEHQVPPDKLSRWASQFQRTDEQDIQVQSEEKTTHPRERRHNSRNDGLILPVDHVALCTIGMYK